MEVKYIIVQAGGKGTRLGRLTKNKPKALVPINNLPMMFYLFKQYPRARFIIITDYMADVMHRYLASFADVQYLVVDACGHTGTCAGIALALDKLPEERPFMLIWSDLVLPTDFQLPDEEGNYIGLSKGFPCRWRYVDGRFEEISSDDAGVAGLFVFKNKSRIGGVPQDGEFVRWLQSREMVFEPVALEHTKEYGLLTTVEDSEDKSKAYRCRPFNRIRVSEDGGRIIKEGIDKQGKELAFREKSWYKFVQERGFKNIPKIYSYDPFIMERIDGRNIFEYDLDMSQKVTLLKKLIQSLRALHGLSSAPTDYFSIYDAYIKKTWDRLERIRDLVPFADRKTVRVNGKDCRNIFFHKRDIERRFADYRCERFVLLHGDNTFSNLMLDQQSEPIFIDPRGYFGHTELYGDPAYDWAKLYYSIVGNYDQFNRKRFALDIKEDEARLFIHSNGWENMEEVFFAELGDDVDRSMIRLIHAIIWLSLTTYAWEDYDSICGAFYNGLYYLEDVL